MSITRIAIYHNTEGRHSKQYEIVVEEDDRRPGIYTVTGRWGKIGYGPQGTMAYAAGVSRQAAMSKFMEMQRIRYERGYRKISDTSEIVVDAPRPNVTPLVKPKKKAIDLRPGAGRKVESEEDL